MAPDRFPNEKYRYDRVRDESLGDDGRRRGEKEKEGKKGHKPVHLNKLELACLPFEEFLDSVHDVRKELILRNSLGPIRHDCRRLNDAIQATFKTTEGRPRSSVGPLRESAKREEDIRRNPPAPSRSSFLSSSMSNSLIEKLWASFAQSDEQRQAVYALLDAWKTGKSIPKPPSEFNLQPGVRIILSEPLLPLILAIIIPTSLSLLKCVKLLVFQRQKLTDFVFCP